MTEIRYDPIRCLDPSHRSQSSDKAWDECQFKANAIATGKAKATFPPRVAVGSAVDFIAKERLLGRDPDSETTVLKYLQECGSPVSALDEATVKTNALLDLWEDQVRPEWERVGIWGVEVEEHFPIDIAGAIIYHVHIDVVLNDGTVRDLKTGDERLGLDRAVTDVQLTTYAAAIWSVYGHIPPKVGLDGLIYANPPKDVKEVRPHATKPWLDRQDSTRTEAQLKSWLASASRREYSRSYAKASGILQTQGRTAPYACKGCPAQPLCPEWQGWEGMYEGSINHGAA